MRFRTPEWKARIAALAGFTLLLQAVLSSLTPFVALSADAIESLAAHALCFGSGARRGDLTVRRPFPIGRTKAAASCVWSPRSTQAHRLPN